MSSRSLGCLDSPLRLLLKRVEDIDNVREPHGVHSPVPVPRVFINFFENSRPAVALERFRVRVLSAELRYEKGLARHVLHFVRELAQIFQRRPHPEKRFHEALAMHYGIFTISALGIHHLSTRHPDSDKESSTDARARHYVTIAPSNSSRAATLVVLPAPRTLIAYLGGNRD